MVNVASLFRRKPRKMSTRRMAQAQDAQVVMTTPPYSRILQAGEKPFGEATRPCALSGYRILRFSLDSQQGRAIALVDPLSPRRYTTPTVRKESNERAYIIN